MIKHQNRIIDRLRVARDAQEVQALLSEAAMFCNASEQTRKRHQKFAAKRLAELEVTKCSAL